MIREFFENMPILSIILVIAILSVAFIIVDGVMSKPVPFYGTVVDKHYKAEINSSGTGYGMTSSGKSGVIFTSQHEAEEFLLIVKTGNGNLVTVECEPELYYKKEVGQKINCNAYKGYFTGWTWSLCGSF